jgi:hypothetical protein
VEQRLTARYTIRPGMLASLLAGRASYRLVLLATTVLLLPVWGEERYGTYAAAMAAFSWLVAVVLTGPEKTMLKLRPRAGRIGAAVSDALVAVLWWMPLPVAVGFGVAWLNGAEHVAVYLGVAAMQLSLGCTMLLIGLHRAAGRPRSDALSFLTMSVAQVVLLGAAVAGVGPSGYLGAVILVQLAVNLALSVTLGRPSLRIRYRPRLLRRLGWTAVLLASPELFLYLSTAILIVILARSVHAEQIARLYVVSIVWSAGLNLALYVFRLYIPRTSLMLAGRASRQGRARAARLALRAAGWNAVWLVGAAVLIPVAGLADVTSATGQVVVWAGLLATRVPGVAGLLWANYQLENADATAPRVVGLAAVVGLIVTGAAGLVAVTTLGGVGLIVSTAVGELAYSLVVAWLGARREASYVANLAVINPRSEPSESASRAARSDRP